VLIFFQQMFQQLISNYISIETVFMGIIVLLCITILGILISIGHQINFQKQIHQNNLKELNGQIWVQQHIFQNNTIMEEKSIKRQKDTFYKLDIIKEKCLHLYHITKF